MPKKIVIAAVLLVVVGVIYSHSRTSIKIEGVRITIDSGGHHIEGTLGPATTHQMLMKDEGVSIGTFSGDVFVAMLPLETADRLRAQYGDFFKCNAPSAIQAIRAMQGTVLVSNHDKNRQAVSEALSLVKKSRIPVVSFNGSPVVVLKQTFRKMNVEDQSGTVLYFLNDFKILKADYLQ